MGAKPSGSANMGPYPRLRKDGSPLSDFSLKDQDPAPCIFWSSVSAVTLWFPQIHLQKPPAQQHIRLVPVRKECKNDRISSINNVYVLNERKYKIKQGLLSLMNRFQDGTWYDIIITQDILTHSCFSHNVMETMRVSRLKMAMV